MVFCHRLPMHTMRSQFWYKTCCISCNKRSFLSTQSIRSKSGYTLPTFRYAPPYWFLCILTCSISFKWVFVPQKWILYSPQVYKPPMTSSLTLDAYTSHCTPDIIYGYIPDTHCTRDIKLSYPHRIPVCYYTTYTASPDIYRDVFENSYHTTWYSCDYSYPE